MATVTTPPPAIDCSRRTAPIRNTRGQDQILFASDHRLMSFDRCLREAAELQLRDGVLEKYLRGNALAVFDWR